MHHPPSLDDEAALRAWAVPVVDEAAAIAYDAGQESWNQAVWTSADASW